MAYNLGSGWQQLPAGVFDPVPDPETLATNLVTVGVYIAASTVMSALGPMPQVIVMSGSYVQYAFCGALAVIFLFGLGMICLGWLVTDYPARYAPLGRTMTRASHVVLVFAVALRKLVASASTTPAKTASK